MNSLGNEATENWQTCFSVLVSLPSPAFFGVSAATGDITDYHDVVSVATYGCVNTARRVNDGKELTVQQSLRRLILKKAYGTGSG